MSLDPAAAAVADERVRDLVDALATRDPDTILALFTEKASVFGSEDTEVAIGIDALRAFFDGLCHQPAVYAWTWEVTAAGQDGDVVWFVAPGVATLTGDDGNVQTIDPYRLSGVLRREGEQWLFELFNGSEPTVA
ncbi:MAG: nuclear transport factor 2 family protein [Actinobacteria bacterium]|nr:nuclear transport factor 2 family protein [Actinomycetota bacterium]MCA1719799.1 nuclear transport factor 2 family protein [Actinomycetota bacterium]